MNEKRKCFLKMITTLPENVQMDGYYHGNIIYTAKEYTTKEKKEKDNKNSSIYKLN